MSFRDDFMAVNQDFMAGLDGRTAIWNGAKQINILAEHKFHETELVGARFENYDYEMMVNLADVDGVKHGDTFVISDLPDLTMYVTKVDFSDDFGMVHIQLCKQV